MQGPLSHNYQLLSNCTPVLTEVVWLHPEPWKLLDHSLLFAIQQPQDTEAIWRGLRQYYLDDQKFSLLLMHTGQWPPPAPSCR